MAKLNYFLFAKNAQQWRDTRACFLIECFYNHNKDQIITTKSVCQCHSFLP
jgi:hypothetical protein